MKDFYKRFEMLNIGNINVKKKQEMYKNDRRQEKSKKKEIELD